MVAPETVRRKNVLTKKFTETHENIQNIDIKSNIPLKARITNKFDESNESVALYSNSYADDYTQTAGAAATAAVDDSGNTISSLLNNDAHNIILEHTLEMTRNNSTLDLLPVSSSSSSSSSSIETYISDSMEQLINFNDDDNEHDDLLSMATNLTKNPIDADAVSNRMSGINSSSSIIDSSSAIIDSLLGSVMTTATAPVAAITPSSMAQLATSTYFHMIGQAMAAAASADANPHHNTHRSHYQQLVEHQYQHQHHQQHQRVDAVNAIAGNDNENDNTNVKQFILSSATEAATESPLSFWLTSNIATTTPTATATVSASASAAVAVAAAAASTTTSTDSIYNDTLANYWAADSDFLYRHSMSMTVVYCVAYIFVFLVGLIGNSFVIAVVLRAPRMRTVTNYFIVNLAIADILVIVFCLPATLMSNIFLPWMLGWLMCKTVPYIQGVSVAASVYSLIAVSLDRFIAIWWPLKQMTKSRARLMILCIWIIALGSTIPWVLFFDLVPASEAFPAAPDMYLCQEVWPPGTNGNLYFLLAHLIACYLLPMSLITLCYVLIWIKVSTRNIPSDSKDAQMDRMQQKSKVKVIKMLVAVVILFVLSWLPLYVIFARIKFGGEISAEESEILNKVTPIAQWLGASNSCINPILYAFFNKKYRRGFAAIIKSRSCCGRLRNYDNVIIASSTTSTRKSSHYHSSRKSPSSPGLRKTNAVSYIYEQNSLRRHNLMMKQDSNLSQQMLLKQDSHGSRQYLIKQESASSDGSRRLLCQQDSNSSKMSLSKQDSIVSYVEAKRIAHFNHQDTFATQDSISIDSRRGTILKSDGSLISSPISNSTLEYKRQKFVKQDSVISFADQRPEPRRHQLVKQDSVISFADQRKGILNKQDSIIACPNRAGDGTGHHVSILKKTDSQLTNGFSSPRRNIDIYE